MGKPIYHLYKEAFDTDEELEAASAVLQECGFCVVTYTEANAKESLGRHLIEMLCRRQNAGCNMPVEERQPRCGRPTESQST